MAIPTQTRQWAERLTAAVETGTGGGHFVDDGRLTVEWAEQRSDGEIGKARVAVRLGDGFDAASALDAYHPDRRIAIRLGEDVVFEGYPAMRRFEQRPSKARSKARITHHLVLDLVQSSIRAKRAEVAQVFGRFVRDAAILDRITAGDARARRETVRATGLACVFNPKGVGNCAPDPIVVDDGRGGTHDVHIFTDDLDASGVRWTYARAIRYLLHFHSDSGDGPGGSSVMDRTEAFAGSVARDRVDYLQSDLLAYRLLDEPFDVSVDGENLLTAMRQVCRSARVHFDAGRHGVGTGVRTAWRIWVSEDAPVRRLSVNDRPRDSVGLPVAQATDMPLREWLVARGGGRASVQWDGSSVATSAIVIGDVRHYVVTAELKPGWLPETDLDNVPMESRSAAKSAAKSDADLLALGAGAATDDWFRRYHRQGADFVAHRDVARVWVLNESGEFTTGTHGREGSFSAYSPFDLSFFEGCRLRRRRPLVGVATNADPVPRVRVDVSFDSGETWHAQQGGYELLNDMAGLRFTPDNPVTICSPYVATDHLWAALVDQAMRVRVTAAIASDDRVMGTAQGRFARSALPSARIVYATERLRCLSLSDGAQDDVVTFDDSAIAKMMAVESARDGEGQTMHGDVKIPWLDAGIRIGDRVAGLDGVGLPAAVSRPPRDAHPFVTAIRYENQSDEYGTTISYAYEMNRDVGQ